MTDGQARPARRGYRPKSQAPKASNPGERDKMCNLIGCAVQQALTRRGFIAGSAIGASLIAPLMCSAVAGDGSLDTQIQLAQSSADATSSRTRLLLLGTAGGPT